MYDDLVKMSFDELDKWVDSPRRDYEQWMIQIVQHPTIGKNEKDMKAFSQLRSYDVDDFYIDDPMIPNHLVSLQTFPNTLEQ